MLNIGLLSRYKPNGGGTLLRLTSIGVVSSWPRFAEAFEASRHMPGFDPASMGASGDSSCEIDVSGLAASAPAEMPVEDGIVDASSTDFKLPADSSPALQATQDRRGRRQLLAAGPAAGGGVCGRICLPSLRKRARSRRSETRRARRLPAKTRQPRGRPAPAAEARSRRSGLESSCEDRCCRGGNRR